MKRLLLMTPLLLGLLPHLAYGQTKNTPLETTVRGRVTDAQSGAPLRETAIVSVERSARFKQWLEGP
jgi:hypothetical protein